MALRVLFIGGSGQISLPCVIEAVAEGHEVTVINRGLTEDILPDVVTRLTADFHDDRSYSDQLSGVYDVVCQFLVFEPRQAARDVEIFSGRAGQYIFVSTASAYQKPVGAKPITESVPLDNPYWQYSRLKAACEKILLGQSDLPVTIVRPSHTIRTKFPTAFGEGDTALSRMLRGKPIIVPGDGKALWTLTRAEDFAPPFIRLFAADKAIGEAFHLTSDYAFPWDDIYRAVGRAIGVEPNLVHVPTDNLVRFHPDWEGFLKGDKAYTVLFDNSKIKSVVGEFTCEDDLDTMMMEPKRHWQKRQDAAAAGQPTELDDLFTQIIEMQTQVKP